MTMFESGSGATPFPAVEAPQVEGVDPDAASKAAVDALNSSIAAKNASLTPRSDAFFASRGGVIVLSEIQDFTNGFELEVLEAAREQVRLQGVANAARAALAALVTLRALKIRADDPATAPAERARLLADYEGRRENAWNNAEAINEGADA